MMEKYTPVTRLRNASQPNTSAKIPGASTTINKAKGNQSNPSQYQGNSCQSRNTMKSGSNGLPYTPRSPIWRIRYIPMA